MTINSNPTGGDGVRTMKRFNYGLIGISILACLSMFSIQGCEEVTEAAEGFCGPCGSIETGDFSVSGNAQLDGFFQAVGTMQMATASVRGQFNADILALAEVYGLAEGEVNADFVNDLIAEIKADISANVSGGLVIDYQPPKCSASVEVAVSAQAKCEAQAECDVQVDPGQVSVACEGKCSGGCTGECTGELSCAVEAPSIECEGECSGSCEMSASATCEGSCHGTCSGSCSAYDGQGNCAGKCEGNCQGTCELSAQATCEGTCHGTCYVDQGSAQCSAEAKCSGSCSAECSGSCEGSFEPPSASANCSASAECKAQAEANANASLECTPPSLDLGYEFAAGVNAEAQAQFIARLGELRVRGAAIIQGFAKFSALIDGEVDGEVVFPEPPLAQLTASVQGLLSANAYANLDIPEGRLVCLADAFQASFDAMGTIAADIEATVSAQASFVAFITTGS